MKKLIESVEKNYRANFENLKDKRFHFASRLFLWRNDQFFKEKLTQLKAEYIGNNNEEYAEKIAHFFREESHSKNSKFMEVRKPFLEKYPLLKKYNKILFRNLFCKNIFGEDLKRIIEEQIATGDLLQLKKELENDPAAIAALSTHAINFLYTLDFYLDHPEGFVDENLFITIAKNADIFKDKKYVELKIYLLTHCVIGKSEFYFNKPIENSEKYQEMLKIAEDEIIDLYNDISLDNKVEFLVCCKLCNYQTSLNLRIMDETKESFDKERQYFIEKNNIKRGKSDNICIAEHRNVLAIMAFGN